MSAEYIVCHFVLFTALHFPQVAQKKIIIALNIEINLFYSTVRLTYSQHIDLLFLFGLHVI